MYIGPHTYVTCALHWEFLPTWFPDKLVVVNVTSGFPFHIDLKLSNSDNHTPKLEQPANDRISGSSLCEDSDEPDRFAARLVFWSQNRSILRPVLMQLQPRKEVEFRLA